MDWFALNLSIPIINLYTGLGLLLGIGGTTLMQVLRGRGEKENHSFFTLSIIFAVMFGLILTLVRILEWL